MNCVEHGSFPDEGSCPDCTPLVRENMTSRDWFAILALQSVFETHHITMRCRDVALYSICLAGTLIKELDKEKK